MRRDRRPQGQIAGAADGAASTPARMKIGLIVPGFSAHAGDWCIPVLVDVVRELSDCADVHVFALRYPYRRERFRLHGAEVHAIGAGTARGLRRLGPLTAAWAAILAEHRRTPFAGLHGLWADEPGFIAVTAARLFRIPATVSVMGGELIAMPDIEYGGHLAPVNRLLTSVALAGAGCVTGASDQAAGPARRRTEPSHGEGRAVKRLVWGVDPCLFQLRGDVRDLAGSTRVLHVGSLVPIKDQATLLRAMAHLKEADPGAHLHIVGEGPLRPQLAQQAKALGLASHITFHGHVERRELGAYYRAADVVAVSSRYEAQLVVALEAALCGTPIVGTAVGLVADFAPEAAIAVPIGDERALAAAIRAARNPQTGQSLATAAERRVRSQYLAAHTAQNLMSMYRSLVMAKRQR